MSFLVALYIMQKHAQKGSSVDGEKMLKWSSQKVQNTTFCSPLTGFLLCNEGSSMTVRYVCVYSITGKLINDLCGLNICSNPFNRLPVSQAKRKIVLTLFKRFYFLNTFIK